MKNKIIVQDTNIKINQYNKDDYLSLTDIARHKDSKRSDYILQNWMRSKDTIEFLGLWENINNNNFNSIEFDGIKNKAGVNSFILTPKQWINTSNANITYANEADILNTALFGMTAKRWRDENIDKSGNLRDYASVEQLIVLSNMESLNSLLIKQNMPQYERLIQLNQIAISQMKSLVHNSSLKRLAGDK